MPGAIILRTSVTPDGDNDLVQIEISDGQLLAEPQSTAGSIRLTVEATTRAYKNPPMTCVQLAAIEVALEALRNISTQLRKEIQDSGYGIPPYKNQNR